MKAFGIGCFNFGISDPRKNTLSIKAYITHLKNTLKKISAIENIAIDCAEDDTLIVISGDEQNAFPHFEFLNISFIVNITENVQSELVGYSIQNVERFKVSIRHNFYMPVAFVECLNESYSNMTPADGVQIVREFLSREIPKANSFITFESLGPSPFHLELYVDESKDPILDKILSTEVENSAYNTITFLFDNNYFSTIEEATQYIYDEIQSEIDVFYKIVFNNVEQMKKWSDINKDIYVLMEMEKSKGFITRMKNKYSSYHLRNKILQELYLFKAHDELCRNDIDRTFNCEYKGVANKHLKAHVQNEKDEVDKYPITSIIEWLKHKEDNSIKIFDIFSRAATAILGGVIGGLITYWFK